MTIYDVLDTLASINIDVRDKMVEVLANNTVKVQTIKLRLEIKNQKAIDVLDEELSVKKYLTDIQYDDLKDRLS